MLGPKVSIIHRLHCIMHYSLLSPVAIRAQLLEYWLCSIFELVWVCQVKDVKVLVHWNGRVHPLVISLMALLQRQLLCIYVKCKLCHELISFHTPLTYLSTSSLKYPTSLRVRIVMASPRNTRHSIVDTAQQIVVPLFFISLFPELADCALATCIYMAS